ncbi:hypothetical protein SPI_08688 [Niveomyces insectorum RCEF 264]|uniref:Uncharacterized protein n=1 Tax=Niveomyces insectorum RCEF 264 TaxID=1081102 RepID=A0A167MVX9_9HYPO|nr:hypothetical protein SPI_08688 [Niveomyces insectorum RCEF 264]
MAFGPDHHSQSMATALLSRRHASSSNERHYYRGAFKLVYSGKSSSARRDHQHTQSSGDDALNKLLLKKGGRRTVARNGDVARIPARLTTHLLSRPPVRRLLCFVWTRSSRTPYSGTRTCGVR